MSISQNQRTFYSLCHRDRDRDRDRVLDTGVRGFWKTTWPRSRRSSRTTANSSSASRRVGIKVEKKEEENPPRPFLNHRLAARKGGIGVAEAISRNKRLKAALRARENEIENARDAEAAQIEASRQRGNFSRTISRV